MKAAATFFGALAILCIVTCAFAANRDETSAYTASVFFTPDEVAKIAAPGEKPSTTAAAPADIHLGAVLYYGEGRWSVWLDGTRWTPETRRADLQIIEVRPELVRLELQGMPLQTIVLEPYQTWQAATRSVVEGMR